ncbi:MAG: F0F1 ATP synthase subunit epsilon [Terriglobia bacterium]
MEKLHLEIVTPARLVLSEDVDDVQVPGKNGYLGILPGHAPLISELQIGEVSYRQGKDRHRMSLVNGFCEVVRDQVRILAESAEKADEIDLARARASKERAEKRLADVSNPDIDFVRAMASLQRALTRIRVGEESRDH